MIVLTDNKHYTDIANAIRSKAVSTDTYTPSQMASAIEDVYASGYATGNVDGFERGEREGFDDGKQAEYDTFWDSYQYFGNRRDYDRTFTGGFTVSVASPTTPLPS